MNLKNLLIGVMLATASITLSQALEEEVIEEEIIEEEILDDNTIIEEEIIEEEILEEEFIAEESFEIPNEDISTIQSENVKVSTFKSEVSGNVRGDFRYFMDEGLYPEQEDTYFSSVFNPEIYTEWDKGKHIVQFKGFARINQYDTKQTHADIRELYYQRVFNKWELSLGVKKIYWGFTESNHLVNIINQDDVLEGSDIENKLGQPMIHFSSEKKWGVLDLMVMTYFRELQFPGIKGRARPPFEIDSENTQYESDAKEYNPDLAIRWSHSIKAFDFSLSHFYGTNRTPLVLTTDGVRFSPFYELINQTGLAVQATTGSMLWKFEGINRLSERKTITALTVGGEYTFSNIFKTDLGLLFEYNYDDRGLDESFNSLTDDFFVGMRIAFNDKQSSDFLGGVNIDRVRSTRSFFVEANRRLGNSWKASIEMLGFSNAAPSEFVYLMRQDGYLQASLAHYF